MMPVPKPSLSERFAEMAKRHGWDKEQDDLSAEEFALAQLDGLVALAKRNGWNERNNPEIPLDWMRSICDEREQEIHMEGPGDREWTEDSVRGALVKIREAVLRANLKAEIVTATLDEEDKARLLIAKEIEDETFYSWANLDNVIQRFTDDSESAEVSP